MKEETRFNSDMAEAQLNTKKLDSIFNIDRNTLILDSQDNSDKQLQDIQNMRKEIEELSKKTSPDPDSILYDNIQRANRLLDKAEDSLDHGGIDNRRLEVMAQLINAITSASSSIMGESYNQQMLEHKERELDIKEQQILLKQTLKGEKANITQNNLIVTNREDLLKMINNEQNVDCE